MRNSIKVDVTDDQIAKAKHNLKIMKEDIDDETLEKHWYSLSEQLIYEVKKLIIHIIINKNNWVFPIDWFDTSRKTTISEKITSPSTMYYNNFDNALATRVSLWVPKWKELSMLITKLYERFFPWKWKTVFFDRWFCNRAFAQYPNWYCSERQYKKFIDTLEYELERFSEKWYNIHNFFLYISKEIQEKRLDERKNDPLRMFRYSESDKNALKHYDIIKKQVWKVAKIYDKAWLPFTLINTDDEELWFINFLKALLENWDYWKKSKKIDFTPDKTIVISWVNEILKYTWQEKLKK